MRGSQAIVWLTKGRNSLTLNCKARPMPHRIPVLQKEQCGALPGHQPVNAATGRNSMSLNRRKFLKVGAAAAPAALAAPAYAQGKRKLPRS